MIKISLLVSALINNYNYGRFIGEAIESVLNQTYQNIELIIVDDGSTDNSGEIISKYAEKFPDKIIAVFKENGGQASAFNSGFKLAKGEIICFLDSDDYWFETKVEKIVDAHNKADIVEHGMLNTGEHCRWVPDKKQAAYQMFEKGRFLRFAETSALSFKKDILDNIFPIPEKGIEICSETFLVYSALYYNPQIKTLREALSFYRIHGENHWYDNENADKNTFSKIISLINENLKEKGANPIIFGQERINKIISELKLESKVKYVLYGTGSLSRILYDKMKKEKKEVIYFIDSFVDDGSTKINNITILPVSEIQKYQKDFDFIIIASSFKIQILRTLSMYDFEESRIITLDI
ncbi:glycosyltransferase family 2 protein [Sporosarcina sp. FSL K6-3457]|uniref:glycosyltransferase family 2 protein n=1 Tax=Sporosarcina sp. FSL K6-3457 TaxID=2978204 RepID=UPI0030FCB027